MPCYHPIPAWRTDSTVQLHKQLADGAPLALPCGTCLGCRATRAQHWALRCHLESLDHRDTAVTTLTYDDDFLPPTLEKRALQLWLKRLRKNKARKIRFFACGEYGEQFGRPHYHAILFGVNAEESESIDNAWQRGRTKTDNVSLKAINYVTGYTVKKIGWSSRHLEERIDYETGEVYNWQPPFQLMSRRPGLGATARQHFHSWKQYAISNGAKLSVPRYLKDAWEDQAEPNDKEDNDYKKYQYALAREANQLTQEQLERREKNHYVRQKFYSALRRYE